MADIPRLRDDADAYAAYFAGMDASMRQKVALTTAWFPVSGTVADMGSGSGRGTFDLACLHPSLELVGVDLDPHAVESSRAAWQRPNLRYKAGDIAEMVFPKESLDGILDSSVLHHVTSYNGYSMDRLAVCLDRQVAQLKPRGVILIRDFVIPEGPEEVLLDLPAGDGADSGDPAALSTAALLLRYAATVSHSRYGPGRPMPVEERPAPRDGWRSFRVLLRDAQEFLLRKDYRAEWEQELREEYAYFTPAQFRGELAARGLRVLVAAPVRNPWVVANRYEGKAALRTLDGKPLPFPPTNFLIAAERPAPGSAVALRVGEARRLERPAFLKLSAWRGAGHAWDLAERPGRTVDLLPWWRAQDGALRILARRAFPRPLAATGEDLAGGWWSGWVTEPLSAITGDGEPLADAALRILRERGGVVHARAVGEPAATFPSPGGLDEVVWSVPVELFGAPEEFRPGQGDLGEAGSVRELDACALLRAGQVGGSCDPRLETAVYRLIRRLGKDPGPWIGADLGTAPAEVPWGEDPVALSPVQGPPFIPAPSPGFLETVEVEACAVDAAGRTLARARRECVRPAMPGIGEHSAVVLPLAVRGGKLLVGLEHRHLPAARALRPDGGLAVAPAFRLPVPAPDHAARQGWLVERMQAQFGVAIHRMAELGGAYLTSPGALRERVQPYAAWVDPAAGPGSLHWVALEKVLEEREGEMRDGHLVLAGWRVWHGVGDENLIAIVEGEA